MKVNGNNYVIYCNFLKKLKPDRKIYSKVTEGISNAHQSHELPETAHFYGGAQEQSLNHT